MSFHDGTVSGCIGVKNVSEVKRGKRISTVQEQLQMDYIKCTCWLYVHAAENYSKAFSLAFSTLRLVKQRYLLFQKNNGSCAALSQTKKPN